MIDKKIGRLKLKLYNGIDELPAERYHKFNLYCLLASGIGSDVTALNNHITTIYQALQMKDFARLKTLFENYYMNLNYTIQGMDLNSMAFVCLIHSINGKEILDSSDENLMKISKEISKHEKRSKYLNLFREIKKKLKMKSKYISPVKIAKQKQDNIIALLKSVQVHY